MNKNELCKKLDEMKDGLDLLEPLTEEISKRMLAKRTNKLSLNEPYLSHIHDKIEQYPKVKEKLINLGFTFDKVPSLSFYKIEDVKILRPKKFLGIFKTYDLVQKTTPIYYGEHYEVSICCEEK